MTIPSLLAAITLIVFITAYGAHQKVDRVSSVDLQEIFR